MNLIIFLVGVLLGGIATYTVLKIVEKRQTAVSSEIYEKMQLQFENLSNKIFKESTQDFSNLTKERVSEILEPFKEKFEELKKQSTVNNEQFVKLDEHIKNVIETGNKINTDTNTLASALKGDNMKQGKWGELILERVLELSGLRKGEEYVTQTGIGLKKPDATILLPNNRAIFVDAKTTFSSYEAYLNSESEEEKAHYFEQFRTSVKAHIKDLSQKEYFDTEEYTSPEYVLMFIPIESCYAMLFANNNDLWELAWKNKIMPVSPSTLLSALKIIDNFNIVSRQNKNAQEIASLAGKMIDKFAGLAIDINAVQKSLSNAATKLSGKDNLVRQAERLQELGAKASKQIPEISVEETV